MWTSWCLYHDRQLFARCVKLLLQPVRFWVWQAVRCLSAHHGCCRDLTTSHCFIYWHFSSVQAGLVFWMLWICIALNVPGQKKKKKNPYWHVWYQPLYHIWASSDHSAWTQAGQPMNLCTFLVCTYCMALTLCVTSARRDGRQVLAASIATSLLIYNRTFAAVYHIMYPSEQLCLNVHPCCQTCHFTTEPDNAASS